MERIAHLAKSFEQAAAWDEAQQRAMTPDERLAVAKVLRDRAYGTDCPDVREAERERAHVSRPAPLELQSGAGHRGTDAQPRIPVRTALIVALLLFYPFWGWLGAPSALAVSVGFLCVAGCVAWLLRRRERRDQQRGWRVLVDRGEIVNYEEWTGDSWRGVGFDADLFGSPGWVAIADDAAWARHPSWAIDQRAEIVSRIQQALRSRWAYAHALRDSPPAANAPFEAPSSRR